MSSTNRRERSDALLERAAEAHSTLPRVHEPPFAPQIGVASDYSRLFEREFSGSAEPRELAEMALRRGRVLLHGEGGSGKTTMVRRLLATIAADGHLGVFIDLREWRPELLDLWAQIPSGSVSRMALLLQELARPSVTEEELAAADPAMKRLIVLDGLNETPGPTADELLRVVEGFAERHPASGVLVTDRLLRRSLPGPGWQLALLTGTVPPPGWAPTGLPGPQDNALFLDLAGNADLVAPNLSAVLDLLWTRHVDLSPTELSAAGAAAADAYRRASSRSFDLHDFRGIAGDAPTHKLLEGGALHETDGRATFRHHLYHDDLAARWLASSSERWQPSVLEDLTFRASSFDVLALALTRVEGAAAADSLLRSIYNWNYYGSAYALSEGARLGCVDVSDDMRLALLAMLAERRWDDVRPTAERVNDALRLFTTPDARRLRDANSPNEVVSEVIDMAAGREALAEWLSVFAAEQTPDGVETLLRHVAGDEPLLGWSAANALRRTELDDAQASWLRALLRGADDPVIRWRAAHALGTHPGIDSARALLAALEEDDADRVRYGAVRSLIDQAAADEHLRALILGALEETAESIAADRIVVGELERALLRRRPPSDWVRAVAPLIERLWALAGTESEQDHWREVGDAIERAAS